LERTRGGMCVSCCGANDCTTV